MSIKKALKRKTKKRVSHLGPWNLHFNNQLTSLGGHFGKWKVALYKPYLDIRRPDVPFFDMCFKGISVVFKGKR